MVKDKKPNSHTYTTRSKSMKKQSEYNEHESSSDDEEWEDEDEDEDEDEEFDPKEYQKLLADLFPSKFMNKKIGKQLAPKNKKPSVSDQKQPDKKRKSDKTNTKKSSKDASKKKKREEEEEESEDEESEEEEDSEDEESEEEEEESETKKTKKKTNKKKTNNKKKVLSETEEDGSSSDSDEEYDSDDFDVLSKDTKLNIIFTLGGVPGLDDGDDSDDDSDDDDSDEESDSEDDDEEGESDDDEKVTKKKSKAATNAKSGKSEELDSKELDSKAKTGDDNVVLESTEKEVEGDALCDSEVFDKFNKMIADLPESDKKNDTMKSIINEVKTLEKKHKKEEEKKSKKLRGKNAVKFRKMLRDKNVMNDTKFFESKLSVEQQEVVLKQIEEVKKHSDVDKPYRLAVLDADIPIHFKSIAYKKINSLKYMEPGDGEYYKIKNWVDTFMQVPFGKYKTLPLTLSDGVDASHEFMTKAKGVLDGAVFGLNDAKLQVMQMIGQWIANPDAIGTAIAIKGPMGTGKTTLVKEGISKILGRDFAFIALGGATDSSFLEGHSYTYEGSTWGKIVDILVKCKCMNPIIYFDELDKVSDTPKGEEIIGILTHLTDTTQNSKFHDKYFSELDFDLSRCLFIFSYNDESKVNPILRDRMYRIQTKGYDAKEKSIIANDYIVPSIREQVKFADGDVTIPNDVINHIVEKYTDKEDGVRNLKRCLEIIHTKLNLYRLMKPGTNLFEKDMKIDVAFPVTVTKEMVDKLIKQDQDTGSWRNMYM